MEVNLGQMEVTGPRKPLSVFLGDQLKTWKEWRAGHGSNRLSSETRSVRGVLTEIEDRKYVNLGLSVGSRPQNHFIINIGYYSIAGLLTGYG